MDEGAQTELAESQLNRQAKGKVGTTLQTEEQQPDEGARLEWTRRVPKGREK